MAKGVESASGIVPRWWHSLRTKSTSGENKRCKEAVSSTIGLLSDSYTLVESCRRDGYFMQDGRLFYCCALESESVTWPEVQAAHRCSWVMMRISWHA